MAKNSINMRDLFNGMQKQMEALLNTNREFIEHPGSKGDALEVVWIEWLRTYLPSRYCVDKAIVIDVDGNTSNQIDVIIYDQLYTPFVLNQNGFKYIPAEGVYAVFEVKPDLKGSVSVSESKTLNHIQYTGVKIESVRKLTRTSARIINAGKSVPARPLTEIVGGILTSNNTIAKKTTIESHVRSLIGLETIDIACAIDFGTITVEYSNQYVGEWGLSKNELNEKIHGYYINRSINNIQFSIAEYSLITFFLKLMEFLQQKIGTVAAIDLNAYMQKL